MEVTARHVTNAHGFSFVATNSSDLIELTKTDAPIGTSITVRLSKEVSDSFLEHVWPRCAHWYALSDPKVVFLHKTVDKIAPLPQAFTITTTEANAEVVEWNAFRPPGFSNISWTSNLKFGSPPKAREGTATDERSEVVPSVYCNGFLIGSPWRPDTERPSYSWKYRDKRLIEPASYSWSKERPFERPSLLISDYEGSLPLTLRREQLAGPLPFEDALAADIAWDFLAWCLATAPGGPVWNPAFTADYTATYPLLRKGVGAPLSWLCSSKGVVPLDRALLRERDENQGLVRRSRGF